MSDESAFVQVAADGSGKKVANVAVTEPQAVDASGNAQADLVRYQQRITATDAEGDAQADPNDLLAQIYAAQLRTNELLELLLGAMS